MRLTDVWGTIPGRSPVSSPCDTAEDEATTGSAGLCPQELLVQENTGEGAAQTMGVVSAKRLWYVWWGVGGGDVCQRAPRWAWMRPCLTRLAAPPAAASPSPSTPASTESFLLHTSFFGGLASPSPGPQMLFPVSAWQTPTYPQPPCEVPPPPAPLARWQRRGGSPLISPIP